MIDPLLIDNSVGAYLTAQQKDQDATAIGARFRSARALVPHLNRKSFCEQHDINRYTMQSWENGLHVSKGKNVEKFIEALALEGISCTSEWLFEGKGEPARPFHAIGPAERSNLNQENRWQAWIQTLIAQENDVGGDLVWQEIDR